MQSVAVFVALLAAASAHTIFRSPAHDSAVIKSDQQGGNFAYSVAESPAWGVVSPVVSHVTQPVATTYAVNTVQQPATTTYAVNTVQQPIATTYAVNTVQQPANTWTVAAAPAHTSTIVTGSTPVVSEVKTTVPVVTGTNVATTYGANWPYASGFTYGNAVVDSSSPIIYSAKTNLVGVETEKQINQVHHTVSAPAAVTYTAVQQPSTATIVSSSGTPVTWSSNVQQQLVSSGTPVTWNTVQQPANSIVSSGTQWGSSVVSTPVAATTYSVPSTSVISTGVPAATFNTVSGVSPIGVNQWNNQWGYGYGQPWTGAWNQQVVV